MTLSIILLLIIIQSIILILGAIRIISDILSLIGGAPYVPLPYSVTRKMLESVQPKEGQFLYDLGCGDGRQLILAHMAYGVRGVGIEIGIWPFFKGLLLRKFLKIKKKDVNISLGRIEKTPLHEADIIFLYLFETMLNRLKQKFEKELKPGVKIVSARYKIPGWKAKTIIESELYPIYYYEH